MERLLSDEFNRKGNAFRMPKELLALVEEQKPSLAKKEDSLFTSMQHHQAEFKDELAKIEEVVNSLKNFDNINQYEEMCKKVQTIREKLKEYKEKELNFNRCESLLDKPIIDYGQLNLIEKDFDPSYDLWTIAYKCFKSKYSCHNDEW